jgi:hypothetical protein
MASNICVYGHSLYFNLTGEKKLHLVVSLSSTFVKQLIICPANRLFQ